jgi:hypothetical protein
VREWRIEQRLHERIGHAVKRDIVNQLVAQITRFLLELGKGY